MRGNLIKITWITVLTFLVKKRHPGKLHFDFYILTHKNFKLNLVIVLALVLKSLKVL